MANAMNTLPEDDYDYSEPSDQTGPRGNPIQRLPRHPDTLVGIAPDCRRVLRQAYATVQVAAGRRVTPDGELTTREALAEYARVAALWGVA